MTEPLLFGPASQNWVQVHQYDVPVVIGSSASTATWSGYGVTLTRPTSTTMKFTFPKIYAKLIGFGCQVQPAALTNDLTWAITTDNLATDGTITLTSVVAGSATAPTAADKYFFTFRMSSDQLNDSFTGSV